MALSFFAAAVAVVIDNAFIPKVQFSHDICVAFLLLLIIVMIVIVVLYQTIVYYLSSGTRIQHWLWCLGTWSNMYGFFLEKARSVLLLLVLIIMVTRSSGVMSTTFVMLVLVLDFDINVVDVILVIDVKKHNGSLRCVGQMGEIVSTVYQTYVIVHYSKKHNISLGKQERHHALCIIDLAKGASDQSCHDEVVFVDKNKEREKHKKHEGLVPHVLHTGTHLYIATPRAI